MDALSDVLSLLKPQTPMCGGTDQGGDWSIRFGPYEGLKFHAIITGACWLAVDGVPEPVRVSAGDGYLLPRGRPFQIASDLSLPPADASTVYHPPMNGAIRTINGGGDCLGVGCHFTFAGTRADILLGVLPPTVLIQQDADKAALRWSLEQMMREFREPRPGGLLVIQHLAQMMLIQAIRAYLAEGLEAGVGWLFALADPAIGGSINAMHQDPGHPWTVQNLADRAGLSRSTFALRFKETVGASPLDYLTRWRMLLAGDKLTDSSDPIATIALTVGYESESAFSTAFKRVMGCSPRQYSRGGGGVDAIREPKRLVGVELVS